MADKPSRGLVLYGDGLAHLISPSHTNLHSLAARGVCGFLSLPHSPHAETEDERVVRELAQLLDSHDAYISNNGEHAPTVECQQTSLLPTISERFMGLRTALLATNASVKRFGRKLGFTVFQFDELTNYLNESPQDVIISEIFKLLGFQEGRILETSQFDLVLLHVGHGEKENELEWVNNLVGGIIQTAQPGSEVGSRLHVSIIMSYGAVSNDEDPNLSMLISQKGINSNLSLLIPRQSYTMKGGNLLNNIRHHCPMLIAQWQEAVTRKDMVETFSFKEFKEHGANLAMPADRFLHEVAFKLWKAPKYGA
ncbi:uncharacterized protein LOC122657718 [Telopea speciosissima]|uniref:uncharacterized protein LOC122657718 n=1 Tax=Telopea speciosissima TaxID=54955 RepID=UPI001CC5DC92|nr:uncharacterized protein LOC122657718 [Telopea speciosissima]